MTTSEPIRRSNSTFTATLQQSRHSLVVPLDLQAQLEPAPSLTPPGTASSLSANPITSGTSVSSAAAAAASASGGGGGPASRRNLMVGQLTDALILDMEASTLARHLGVGEEEEEDDEEERERLQQPQQSPQWDGDGGAGGHGNRAVIYTSPEPATPTCQPRAPGDPSLAVAMATAISAISVETVATAAAAAEDEASGKSASTLLPEANMQVAAAATTERVMGSRRRPPPGTPRQPKPDEVGRTEYFSACECQIVSYSTVL